MLQITRILLKKTDSEKDSTNTKDGNVTTSTVELKTSRPGVTKQSRLRQGIVM